MKSYLGFALLACVATFAAADYSIADLPSCSLQCFESSAPQVGCSITDSACQCEKSDALTADMTPCVTKNCSTSDALKTEEVSKGICKQMSSSSASGTATGTSSGSASSTAASTTGSSSVTGTSSAAAAVQSTNHAASGVGSSGVGAVLLAAVGLLVV